FIAEERDGGKEYVIRYPDQFKLNGCVYRSYGGRMRIEEKSDDPRLNKEPYNEKGKAERTTLIYSFWVTQFSLVPNDRLENDKSRMYINKLDYDVYCYKRNIEDINGFGKIGYLKFLSCSSSSIEKNNIEKYLGMEGYTPSFWKDNPSIKINLKISRSEYCNSKKIDFCQKFNLQPFDEKIFYPENFQKFFDEEPY
ncbi:hypothetical protein, partial [Actinobacillus vicugnae]|uniref:hypothetical protein n=1 Tax=Actinobacillus vicugnae TaxID=2573093 RepID=UPI00142EC12C